MLANGVVRRSLNTMAVYRQKRSVFRTLARQFVGRCALAALLIVSFGADSALAVGVQCSQPAADAAGWSVATGGDLDGDGVSDIAVGSPCAIVSGARRVGRVAVYSAVDGSRLLLVRGTQENERFGASVAFVPDTNGDGRDELAVGSSTWDVLQGNGSTRSSAGKVDLYDWSGTLLFSVEGTFGNGNFGEAVAGIPDVTGDQRGEVLAGAGKAQIEGKRRGIAYLLSGTDGALLGQSDGAVNGDTWGSVLASPGDVDGDGTPDVMVASGLAEIPPSTVDLNNGSVQVLSGADMTNVLTVVYGQPESKLGRAVVPGGPQGFVAGAPGSDVNGKNKAGMAILYNWAGAQQRAFKDPAAEINAALGTAVGIIDDANGDGRVDVVAGAPVATGNGLASAGRVLAFSGKKGTVLWTMEGERASARMGQTIASADDITGDGVSDLLVGVPGDIARGRRGAGSVRVVSGTDGSEWMRIRGRRGLETRLFVLGGDVGRRTWLSEHNHKGRRTRRALGRGRSIEAGSFAVAVLDEETNPLPGTLKVALTGGQGSDDLVIVQAAGRRGRVVSRFRGMGGGYTGGVQLAAGDILGDASDDIVTAEADSTDGTVRVKVFSRFDIDPASGLVRWLEQAAFTPYLPLDEVAGQLINARGANVAVGRDAAGPLIYVSPIAGVPVVRAIDQTGLQVNEWVAYFPTDHSGITLTVGDLDGDGKSELVTLPVTGSPEIKAFTFAGVPFVPAGDTVAVDFTLSDPQFMGGARIAVADVDLDGSGEILVASPPGTRSVVMAFEIDGTPVSSWRPMQPFGPARVGLAIAASDRFIRP